MTTAHTEYINITPSNFLMVPGVAIGVTLSGRLFRARGFRPTNAISRKRNAKNMFPTVMVLRMLHIANTHWEKLEACFPVETAGQIYAYSLIMCANGFLHIDQIDDFYQESFLSLVFKGYSFKLGYSAIATLLHNLGSRTNPVKAFEQALIDNSSKEIAIDGHVIRSCSNKNDLADPGYKVRELKTAQVNVLIQSSGGLY